MSILTQFFDRNNLSVGWFLYWRLLTLGLPIIVIIWLVVFVILSVIDIPPSESVTDGLLSISSLLVGILLLDLFGKQLAIRRFGLLVREHIGFSILWRQIIPLIVYAVLPSTLIDIVIGINDSAFMVILVGWYFVVSILATGWAANKVLNRLVQQQHQS